MYKILLTSLFFISCGFFSYSQQSIDLKATSIPASNAVSIEALSSYIKDNFSSDSARVRAIYLWVTNNISYDVPRFLARETSTGSSGQNADEVFASRKGVCQGYSNLFVELCKGVGIEAIRIGGYTKIHGKVSLIGHAWVATLLNNEWYLFDPTWGSGYVNNQVFVKRFNERFYKVHPSAFISDHMPLDPLFQFLSYPLTHQEFIDGKPASNKQLFNFKDSIAQNTKLSFVAQTAAELRRIETAGANNSLLQQRRTYLKNIIGSSDSKNAFDEGGKLYKAAVALYNDLIGHKRNHFNSLTDTDLKYKIDSIESFIKKSRLLITEAEAKTDAHRNAKIQTIGNMDRFWLAVVKQKEFIEKFLTTEKDKRRLLFMKSS